MCRRGAEQLSPIKSWVPTCNKPWLGKARQQEGSPFQKGLKREVRGLGRKGWVFERWKRGGVTNPRLAAGGVYCTYSTRVGRRWGRSCCVCVRVYPRALHTTAQHKSSHAGKLSVCVYLSLSLGCVKGGPGVRESGPSSLSGVFSGAKAPALLGAQRGRRG